MKFLAIALIASLFLSILLLWLYLRTCGIVQKERELNKKRRSQQRELFCQLLSHVWNAPIPKIKRAFMEFGLANIDFLYWDANQFHEWFNDQVVEYGETLGYIHTNEKHLKSAGRHVDQIFN